MKKLILILLLCCISCSVSEKEIPGVYIFKNEYIIDSLIVLNNHSYKRIIISTNNHNILLYSHHNKWSYFDKILELEKFLNKTDSGMNMINSKEPNFKFPIIDTNLNPKKTFFGNIVFEIDRYNYYKKIGNVSN